MEKVTGTSRAGGYVAPAGSLLSTDRVESSRPFASEARLDAPNRRPPAALPAVAHRSHRARAPLRARRPAAGGDVTVPSAPDRRIRRRRWAGHGRHGRTGHGAGPLRDRHDRAGARVRPPAPQDPARAARDRRLPGHPANAENLKLVSQGVGGLILFKRNVVSGPQVRALVKGL